jgi:aerobic-type carbon monoxide dehydrogenase small subunit (CoxS/CutS family)
MERRIIHFRLNGDEIEIAAEPTERFLDIIRKLCGRTGTKEGCGIGECGACTILADGKPVNSCILMAGQMEGADILTIEGLSEEHIGEVLKKCFIEEGAVQCGYCTPGMILSAYALLLNNKNPSREEIKTAMSGNLCRCTGYVPIINAVEKAKEELILEM